MTTLTEIEAAADALSAEQKQELFLFLAARLRGGSRQLPKCGASALISRSLASLIEITRRVNEGD